MSSSWTEKGDISRAAPLETRLGPPQAGTTTCTCTAAMGGEGCTRERVAGGR